MEIDSKQIKEYALFHVNRKIINLYKHLLFVLEDLRDDKFDIKDPRVYQATRKRILDLSNDTIRELSATFDKLEITIKDDINNNIDNNI